MFSAILIRIFLVISACSLDVFETLCISETDREQLRNQQQNIYFITMNNNSCVLCAICVQFEFMVVKTG